MSEHGDERVEGEPSSALQAAAASGAGEGAGTGELVEAPQAVMRVAGMVGKLVEEVRSAPLDEAGRARLADVHARTVAELEQGLAPELRDELHRLSLPFSSGAGGQGGAGGHGAGAPTQAELRVAQAQLLGWLEGLFHGIQSAVLAQQMAARGQLEQIRGARTRSEVSGIDPTGQYL